MQPPAGTNKKLLTDWMPMKVDAHTGLSERFIDLLCAAPNLSKN